MSHHENEKYAVELMGSAQELSQHCATYDFRNPTIPVGDSVLEITTNNPGGELQVDFVKAALGKDTFLGLGAMTGIADEVMLDLFPSGAHVAFFHHPHTGENYSSIFLRDREWGGLIAFNCSADNSSYFELKTAGQTPHKESFGVLRKRPDFPVSAAAYVTHLANPSNTH